MHAWAKLINVYKISVGKPERKSTAEGPRRWWEDIELDLNRPGVRWWEGFNWLRTQPSGGIT